MVITHHAPSRKSIHPRFARSLLSACFVSDAERFLGGSRVQLWVHGHTHDSFDYLVNGTRVICNPRGYAKDGVNENLRFAYSGRALRNRFMKRWHGRESELAAAVATESAVFQAAARAEDYETAMVWAGEAVDLITAVEGAARIVTRTTAEVEARLCSAPLLTRLPSVDAKGTRVADGDPR